MRLLSGSVYALDFPDEPAFFSALPKLEGLPGLRLLTAAKRIEGSIDAVSAACLRLGREVFTLQKPAPYLSPTLRPYQQEGVGWLIETLRKFGGAILADDMGLGKTLQAITTGNELMRGGGRALVLCPAFLRESWKRELEKWSGGAPVATLGPQVNKRAEIEWQKAGQAKWVVTSYDMAHRALPAAFQHNTPRYLVLDEAHYLKGRNVKRSKILSDVAAQCTYRLAITGTPMWSRPKDFYSLLAILFGRRIGSGHEFDLCYCGGVPNPYGGVEANGATNTEELKLRLSYYLLRRLKSEVAKDLPELTRNIVWLDGTPEAKQAMHVALTTKDAGGTARALQATLNAKLEAACNIASQAKQFLLFTYLKAHAHDIHQKLCEEFDTPCEVVTGDMAADQRQKTIELASSRGVGVVATIDSMGAGINAQTLGSTGIFHALDWVPAKLAQAEARLHRIGQTRGVTWTYLAMKDSMDEFVINTIVSKLDQHHLIMGDGRDTLNAFSESQSPDVEAAALQALYDSL